MTGRLTSRDSGETLAARKQRLPVSTATGSISAAGADDGVVALLGIARARRELAVPTRRTPCSARLAGGASLPTVTVRRTDGTRYPPYYSVAG